MNHLQGILKVVVHEARDLFEVNTFGLQDPYCIVKVGKDLQRTPYRPRSGKTAEWNEMMQFKLNKQQLCLEECDKEDLVCVEVWDSNVVKDRFISHVYLRLRELVCSSDPVTKWYPMNRQCKTGRLLVDVTPQDESANSPDIARKVVWQGHCVAGEIRVTTQYYPPMILKVHKARKLHQASWFTTQDPIVHITCGNDAHRTKCCNNGGAEPVWNESVSINPDVRIPREVKPPRAASPDELPSEPQLFRAYVEINVQNANYLVNATIGKAMIPFNTLITNNGTPMWFELARDATGKTFAGEILLSLHPCLPRKPLAKLFADGAAHSLSSEQLEQLQSSSSSQPAADASAASASADSSAPVAKHLIEADAASQQQQQPTEAATAATAASSSLDDTDKEEHGKMNEYWANQDDLYASTEKSISSPRSPMSSPVSQLAVSPKPEPVSVLKAAESSLYKKLAEGVPKDAGEESTAPVAAAVAEPVTTVEL